jgi:hypothetical protein
MNTEIYKYMRAASTEEYVPPSLMEDIKKEPDFSEALIFNADEESSVENFSDEEDSEDSDDDIIGSERHEYLKTEVVEPFESVPDVAIPDVPVMSTPLETEVIGASTLIEIPLIRKDNDIVSIREKVAADFNDYFRSIESKEFSITFGGNVRFYNN